MHLVLLEVNLTSKLDAQHLQCFTRDAFVEAHLLQVFQLVAARLYGHLLQMVEVSWLAIRDVDAQHVHRVHNVVVGYCNLRLQVLAGAVFTQQTPMPLKQLGQHVVEHVPDVANRLQVHG